MDQLSPIPDGFTAVIATRSFDLIEDGVSSKLVVEIGIPIQDVETVDGFSWRCPIRLIRGTSIQEDRACGEDAVQSLELALKVVHNEIERLSQDKSLQILLFDHPYDQLIQMDKLIQMQADLNVQIAQMQADLGLPLP